jgi:hypothetical protein
MPCRNHVGDGIFLEGYIPAMVWDVVYTDAFGEWWESLTEDEQESLAASVRHLVDPWGQDR